MAKKIVKLKIDFEELTTTVTETVAICFSR